MKRKIPFIILTIAGIWIAYLLIPLETKFFYKEATQSLIDSAPYHLDDGGWTLILAGKTDGQNSLSFEQVDGDSSKHVIFAVDDNKVPAKIIRYTKSFRTGDGIFTVQMNSKDTLFAYLIRNSNDTIFSKGEYFYKYTHIQLDSAERKFYLLYKDSLRFVNGDNLPPLPSLNSQERRIFKSKFK
jgi:hypothetical protein